MPLPSLSSSLRSKYSLSDKSRETKTRPEKLSSATRLPHSKNLTEPDPPPRERHSPTRLPLPPGSSRCQDEGVGIKRRSFLLQRGEQRTNTSISGLGLEAQTHGGSQTLSRGEVDVLDASVSSTSSQDRQHLTDRRTRPRPQSMYQRLPSSSESHMDIKRRSQIIEPSEPSKKTSMPPPSALIRSQSLRKPTPSTQTTGPSNIRNHARNSSTHVAPKPRPAPTDSNSGVDQLRKRAHMPFSTNHSPDESVGMVEDGNGGPKGSQQSLLQPLVKSSASASSRSERPESAASTGTADTEPAVATSNTARRREPAKDDGHRRARPAFSTLQQHFTPRKTGKAPTSTFIHPPAPDPTTSGMSSEFVRLQAELLQLHLLHESSAQTCRHWELSAKGKLHQKFNEVATNHQIMRDNERQGLEDINIHALQEWNSGNTSFGLAEHVQLLSAALHELPPLTYPGGRYARLIDGFEKWIAWVEEVWDVRNHGHYGRNRDLNFAEGLGDSWKAENASLTRKLTSFSRDLEAMVEPEPGSTIAIIVSRCRNLLRGMLQELQIMQSIEADVISREREWIEEGLAAIAGDIGAHLIETEGHGSWRD
ncbi:hypothetical protein K432DRAFT_318321 [Lepidopterella palustris CBS 459.81]|uniref:Uncharacterized protein n=1 Tax=Lepidopterella palustris CBS 459.81 TaxID=1314670 RepID=A0A8E2EJX5_9PEZI|nr:hypothetical protein K432DRAFT_318321 [Lepidopterella palustris CBS 459.81]